MYSCKQKVNTTEGTGVITSQAPINHDDEMYYWVMFDSSGKECVLCEDEISPFDSNNTPTKEKSSKDVLQEVLDEIFEMEYKLFLLRKKIGNVLTNQ